MAKRVKDIWRKAVTLDNIEASILISMRSMRQKISARDRLRAKANIEKESEEVA